MAISLDGAALDGSGYAGSRQRLPTTEGSQATSGTPCRSGSTSNEKLNPRRPCSSSQRRVTSASAATASQCSTKSGTSPQSCLMLHRTRHLFIRQQTAVINSIRAHLAEFGIVAPVGRKGVTELLHIVADPS